MDLTDLWQEHKRFILAVAGALLLLVIGKSVLSATYPVVSVARECASINEQLRKAPEVKSSLVADVQTEVTLLKTRLKKLKAGMEFTADPVFAAAEHSGNLRAEYFKIVGHMQEVLVDVAERQGIAIPEKLGLQDRAPTDPVEIKRSLRALNVIYNVVILCIEAGVKSVERIVIEEAGRGGSSGLVQESAVEFDVLGREPSIRQLLHDVVELPRTASAAYLEVSTPTRIETVKGERETLHLHLSVTALSISTGDIDLEGE